MKKIFETTKKVFWTTWTLMFALAGVCAISGAIVNALFAENKREELLNQFAKRFT